VRLFSWILLFLLQLYFNVFPVSSFWLRVFLLSSIMLLSPVLWIKLVERRPIKSRLGLDEKGVTALTYAASAAILVFFTRDSFGEATLLTGGALIVPLFEELFFRAYLLGSMVNGWPSLHDLPRMERMRLFKLSLFPLFLTSLSFALVHDDVITTLLSLPLIDPNSLVIFTLRLVFGMTVGGLYLLKGKLIAPVAFHVTFNLSYFLLRG
jgi:membrane protease YdiL (CAAX protease family)